MLKTGLVGLLILPQLAFASWWNPFTWKIFNKTPETKVQTSVVTPSSPSNTSLKKDSAPKLQGSQSAPTKSVPVTKPSTPLKLTNSEIIKKVKPAVVYIETDDGSGSGMVISSEGFVLTNAHVVKGFTNVRVSLSGGSVINGIVVGRDENIDVALIKIEYPQLTAVVFGNSDKVEQGDEVFTLGFPFGIKGDVSFKEGTISRRIGNYLETSAEIHPGNSGGPLVNRYGQVIGINSAAYGNATKGIQLGETIKLAIPVNTAISEIQNLKSGKQIVTPSTEKAEESSNAKEEGLALYKIFTDDYEKSFRERVAAGDLLNSALQNFNLDNNTLALNYSVTAETKLNLSYQIMLNSKIPNLPFSEDIRSFMNKYLDYVNSYSQRAQILKSLSSLPPKRDYYKAEIETAQKLIDEYKKNLDSTFTLYQELYVLQTKLEQSAKKYFGIDVLLSKEK